METVFYFAFHVTGHDAVIRSLYENHRLYGNYGMWQDQTLRESARIQITSRWKRLDSAKSVEISLLFCETQQVSTSVSVAGQAPVTKCLFIAG